MLTGLLALTTSGANARDTALMSVGSGNQWAYSTNPWGLINAWNAGPWVRNYYGGLPTSTNDDFTDITLTPTINHALMFSGLGDWAGWCIGDAFNDPNDARASLGKCGHNGIGENWGVDMTTGSSGCSAGWQWFRDVHWGGYLGPASNSNGAQMYLNKPNKYCYDALGAA